VNVAPSAAELAELFDADGVVVFVNDGLELTVGDVWPANASVAPLLRIPVGFGVTGLVARNGKPVLLDEDSPRNPVHRQLLGLAEGETVARMCLPARGLSDVVTGVLAVHRPPPRPFTTADLDAVTPYAALVGLELHAEQLWRAVHRHRTDRDRLIEAAISAQEAERRRIAFDLHDGVTTALASMSFHLSAADLSIADLVGTTPGSKAAERVRAEVGAARQLADLAYHQTRIAISGLHSLVLDDLGLVAATTGRWSTWWSTRVRPSTTSRTMPQPRSTGSPRRPWATRSSMRGPTGFCCRCAGSGSRSCSAAPTTVSASTPRSDALPAPPMTASSTSGCPRSRSAAP